jgi:hypothetical protein
VVIMIFLDLYLYLWSRKFLWGRQLIVIYYSYVIVRVVKKLRKGGLIQCSWYMLYRVRHTVGYDLYSFVEESGSEFLSFILCTNEGYFCNGSKALEPHIGGGP